MDRVKIENNWFEILISINKSINPISITNKLTKFKYADADYLYQLYPGVKEELLYEGHEINEVEKGISKVVFSGTLNDGIRVRHSFIIPDKQPFFDEYISIENISNHPIETLSPYFGFTKKVDIQGDDLTRYKFVAVPFKHRLLVPDYNPPLEPKPGISIRGTEEGPEDEYEEYSISELFEKSGWYRLSWGKPKIRTPEFGSEGWIWTDGENSLLIIKYSQDGIEFSLLKPEKKENEFLLHFGGAGVWHNDPEKALKIGPKGKILFGVTRYILVRGDWKEAYYTFREYMDSKGHITPKGFNPPVHWNELYDNKLWWSEDTPENRRKFYSLPQIEEEAQKAQEVGCEALYLDPGWDTSFGSSLWAEDRLLKCREFVDLMKNKYNLKVSLHTPLAAWSDVNAYPIEARRKDKDGKILESLCSGAPAYIETKTERLLKLAKDGIVYFMFDGSGFTGECYDEAHGHSIPYTREEHCRSILKLIQNIHKEYPNVLIELHDPIVAGVPIRYTPIYYLHGLPYSFDEVWAFEYMWDPMDDLLSGRAKSLYYYNLAYSLPLYIHIDLRKDNEHALEFWWYASTCRHLGIGGKHPNPKVWNAHKQAMKEYMRLKQFYTQGIFYGLDETIHAHTIPEEKTSVLNIFNLTKEPKTREIRFDLSEIGLPKNLKVLITDLRYSQEGSSISLKISLPPLGTTLVEIRAV